MKLNSFRIRKFKSFHDSGEVPVDPRVTVLVGQNEAGKTATLKALYKAMPAEGERGYQLEEDYPRSEMLDYEAHLEEGGDAANTVVCDYELHPCEVEELNDLLEVELFSDFKFVVTTRFDGTQVPSFPTQEAMFVAARLKKVDLSTDAAKAAAGVQTVSAVVELLQDDRFTEADRNFAAELDTQFPSYGTWSRLQRKIWKEFLSERIPVFLYFDDYRLLPGRASLTQLQKRQQQKKLTESDQTVLRLLRQARVDLDKLLTPGSYEKFKARLEATSSRVTREVFKYWRQNDKLSVQFDVREDSTDEPPFDEGLNLYVRISSSRHDVTMPFDQRSKGFIWFFSFLTWFGAVREGMSNERDIVLLLDEPGLSLHALAQADFLTYIESLSEKYQVLYTTHSPFMIDSGELQRVRLVEDSGEVGTTVRTNMSGSDPKTLFPLQAALGYSIAQNLFIAEENVLVEGVSDLAYLQAVSSLLTQDGREGLREDAVIVPVGGLKKVPAFVSLFGANDLNIVVLHDDEGQPDQQIERLTRDKLLHPRQVLKYSQFSTGGKGAAADIEDLFQPGEYVRLFNSTFKAQLAVKAATVKELPPGDRVVLRLNHWLKQEGISLRPSGGFNHFAVAKRFLEKPAKLDGSTLDRFETLFRKVNAVLAAGKRQA